MFHMKQRSAVLTYVSRETLVRYGTIFRVPRGRGGRSVRPVRAARGADATANLPAPPAGWRGLLPDRFGKPARAPRQRDRVAGLSTTVNTGWRAIPGRAEPASTKSPGRWDCGCPPLSSCLDLFRASTSCGIVVRARRGRGGGGTWMPGTSPGMTVGESDGVGPQRSPRGGRPQACHPGLEPGSRLAPDYDPGEAGRGRCLRLWTPARGRGDSGANDRPHAGSG